MEITLLVAGVDVVMAGDMDMESVPTGGDTGIMDVADGISAGGGKKFKFIYCFV